MSAFAITLKHFDPLCKDYEFVIVNYDELVDMISHLLMGHYLHISNMLKGLDPHYPDNDKDTIDYLLGELKTDGKDDEYIIKIHGWLFQMISWLVLAELHKTDHAFYQQFPHPQKSMHGLDGIALSLNEYGSIDRIIITEDKCTDNPRRIIREDVFPEFEEIEKGKKNNAIFQHAASLIAPDSFLKIQNDVCKTEKRQYRIGITRKKCHNSEKGRRQLYEGYDNYVTGEDVLRRTASSIQIDGMREWMDQLRIDIIEKLSSLKSK